MLPLTCSLKTVRGFLANVKSRLCGKVDDLEVIGEFDVSDEAENSAQPLKKLKLNASSDLLINKKKQLNESVDSTYMNVVLGLIETLCQLSQQLSDDDLDEATVAVSYVAKGGLKVYWLRRSRK
ncbi:hypothetical protein EUTSA_v10028067mg [Eutrema salsugineum]|uniref:Uncharacterized protein n=1 Tax=Eutrema salsugineum TaxID=72664 RepID=V4NKK5_EUTSA|nr:hypothetical protein EUTSA_v10028067mg [Eutrema salsugineum]